MTSKRKLWATRSTPVMGYKRHDSRADASRYVATGREAWARGSLRHRYMTVYVDERDGQGWRVYEEINLAERAGQPGEGGS